MSEGIAESRSPAGRAGFEKWDDFVVLDLKSGRRLHRVQVNSDPIEMALTPTGMRLVTHGRFPMSQEGIAQIIDWEFDGGKPRARMLVNGKQRLVTQRVADLNGDQLPDMVATAFGDGYMGMAQSLLAEQGPVVVLADVEVAACRAVVDGSLTAQ